MYKTSPLHMFSLTRMLIGAGIFIALLSPAAQATAPRATPQTTTEVAKAQPAVMARLASTALLTSVAQTGSTLVAVGERGHILLSPDGTTWQQMPVPTRALLTAVTFASPTHGWAVGQDATILATTDGGKSWTPQFHTSKLLEEDAARDAPLLAISCASETTCAASGAYGLLLLTSNGGAEWQRVYVKEDDRNYYAVQMLDAQHIVLAGEEGALMESRDGGSEWAALAVPYAGSLFGFTKLSDGWLVYGLRGNAFLTTDESQTWQKIETGVDSGIIGGSVLGNGRVVLVGAGGVVLESSDNARSFTLHRQSKRTALSAVALSPTGSLLLFGEKGVAPAEDK